MKTNGALYWWIANTQDKGDKGKPQTNVDFLRAWLPRASAKIGGQPGVILCNPVDRDSLAELANMFEIGTRANLPAGNFWIGPKCEDKESGASDDK